MLGLGLQRLADLNQTTELLLQLYQIQSLVLQFGRKLGQQQQMLWVLQKLILFQKK
jgi:hypothetical protein